jgi:uncharacterized protein YggU (UPF0235/DUF167 family)
MAKAPAARPRDPTEQVVRLSIRAKPRASRSRIVHAEGTNIQAALAAPPVDGAANAALLELLAAALELPKRALRLVLGETSKNKVVEVTGLSLAELTARLARASRS